MLAVATGRLSAIVTWHSDRLTPAVWECALERRMWDQLRAVRLDPERNTNVWEPTKRLLTGLIHCGGCGAAMLSRPRDDHTKCYVRANRTAGHQIVAQAADDVVAELALASFETPWVPRGSSANRTGEPTTLSSGSGTPWCSRRSTADRSGTETSIGAS